MGTSTNVLIGLGLVVSATAAGLTRQTQYGPVTGFWDILDDVNIWRGIPFAEPPLGNLRWKPPTSPAPWTSPKDTKTEKPACPQNLKKDKSGYLGSEDCLYLDIYAPRAAEEGSNLPVMLFIHGGGWRNGFSLGDPAIPAQTGKLYNGNKLAKQNNVVVVSISYRMGILGFLGLESLRRESPEKGVSNYGLMDQRFAMAWAKKNVLAFGGDPNRILMFGESAGGNAVCTHYASKASAGLFDAALGESPLCAGKLAFQSLNISLNFGELMVKHANCENSDPTKALACMRSASVEDLLLVPNIHDGYLPPNPPNAPPLPWGLPIFPWWPVIDGTFNGVEAHPHKLIEEGKFNDVPLILGTNHNEGSLFLFVIPQRAHVKIPLNEQKVKEVLLTFFPDHHKPVQELLTYYANRDGKTWDDKMSDMMRDGFLACPARYFVRTVHSWRVKRNSPNVNAQWMYMFNETYPGPVDKILGDFHSLELFFVFDHPFFLSGVWEPQEQKLALQMGKYWASFATTHNPNNVTNCDGCVNWPSYQADLTNPKGDNYIILKKGLDTDTDLYTGACNLWDKIGYYTS